MSTSVFNVNGKLYKEVIQNGKLTLVETSQTEVDAIRKVPLSTMGQLVEEKISGFESRVDSITEEVTASVAPKLANLSAQSETVELHDASVFEYEAEKWRWMGQSGLIGTRQYTYGGTKAYHRPFDIAYAPMNIHTHADFMGLQGMAEIVLSMNGYYIRTRHNDYRDYRPHSTSSAYQATERLPRPSLPPLSGDAAAQRTTMQDFYTRLYNTLQENAGTKLTTAEKQLVRWDMAYAECWWEEISNGAVDDPGNNTRHKNASDDVRTMIRDAQYYNYGGHKDNLENTSYWVAAVKEVNNDGTPSFAMLKFRILMMPVATLADYTPSQLFDGVKDYRSLMRFGYSDFTALQNSLHGRFRVKETRDNYGLLDTLVNKIPGLDGGAASITEAYTQYGSTETIFNMTNSAVNNAARYFRYAYINTDASGRNSERRGFNDPYLFVAMNTQEKCKKYDINGRSYRFSYMIPLEMVLRHPLESWNPYSIPEVTSVTGSGTAADPFSGNTENLHWYRTPASFFDARQISDAADTVKTGRFYKGGDGNAYATAASGTYIFLPAIKNSAGTVLVPEGGIRMRWPIYPCFHEGSYAFGEVQALRDYIAAGKTVTA
jgi:hypothetical protein